MVEYTCYFNNVFKKTVGKEYTIELGEYEGAKPRFLLMDIDEDGMPEIVLMSQCNKKGRINILKQQNGEWYLKDSNYTSEGAKEIYEILEATPKLRVKQQSNAVDIKKILTKNNNLFVSVIDENVHYGHIVKANL
ncbi:MAG: hypothetical protein ACRCSG_04215 [Cellulosilyticaceae bacterium]